MSVILKQNTVDISSSVELNSVECTSVLTKEVGRLIFRIKNYPGKATVDLGDQIDLYDGSNHIFGGTVTEKKDEVEGGVLIATNYMANDWSFRLNSKLVAKKYADMDPHDIVVDIINTFTDGTFTTTNVATGGFNVASISFNYEQVTVSLEKLAKQIGWEWFVDADKDVHFFPPTTVVDAPYTIDDTSGNLEWVSLEIDQNLTNMKNSIYVIGGTYNRTFDASNTPDVYLTDGTKTVFPLGYTYTPDTIVVTLAGVSQTIGTDQVTSDASVQVQYNELGRFVRFTTTPATPNLEVKIYGLAQIPILAQVQNNSAIAQYGEIQDVIIDQQIKSIEEAQDRGLAQISQYGSPVYAIKFATLMTGFNVGQTVQVNSAKFGSNTLVIIKRITARPYGPNGLRYELECIGTDQVNFVDIMKLLLTRAQAQTVVSDSTVLQVLKLLQESIASADTLHAPTATSGPYKWSPGSNDFRWNFGTWS